MFQVSNVQFILKINPKNLLTYCKRKIIMQPTNNDSTGNLSASITSSSASQPSFTNWNTRTWSSPPSFQVPSFQVPSFQVPSFKTPSFRPPSYAPSSTSFSPVAHEQPQYQASSPSLNPLQLPPALQEIMPQAFSEDSEKLATQSSQKVALSFSEAKEMLEKLKDIPPEQIAQRMALHQQINASLHSLYDESTEINKAYSSLAFEIATALKESTIESIRADQEQKKD